jgi:SAM-dependent methyltransferase
MLAGIHGGSPRTLGEDFCGAAAISREWCRLIPRGGAVAVDMDPEPLSHAQRPPGMRPVCADVMNAPLTPRLDVIADLNFSICEIRDRPALAAYLRRSHSRLKRGGIFVCDIYGGSDAFLTGRVRETKAGPRGERVTYTWEQRTADPLTGRVNNAMHFRVRPPVTKPSEFAPYSIDNAFVYDWRLWRVPELRDALAQAGFDSTEVYSRFAGASDQEGNLYTHPIEDAAEVGDAFSVYVVGRKA